MAIVMLAVVIFVLFENLKEKKSVPLTKWVWHVLKILVAHRLKIIDLCM